MCFTKGASVDNEPSEDTFYKLHGYYEEDLDRGYRIDCKMRSKENLPWLLRTEFQIVYEKVLAVLLKNLQEVPLEAAIQSIDKILQSNIRFAPDELKEKENHYEI
jgi:hypothetical protein